LGSDQIPAPLLGDTFSASEFLKREKLVVAMRKTKSDDLLQQTEQALRESDECLQSILSSIDEVVWSAAPDGMQIHYINPAPEHIWGLNGGYSTKDGTASTQFRHDQSQIVINRLKSFWLMMRNHTTFV
jgi:hypothetical protein